MRSVLSAMQDYLKSELVQDPDENFTAEKPLAIVDVRPPSWIVEQFSAIFFPALFLWGVSDDFVDGKSEDTADQIIRVQASLYLQSIDDNLALLDSEQGIYGISDRVVDLLSQNKKLDKLTGKRVTDGMELPVLRRDTQVQLEGESFSAVGRLHSIEYIRENIPWNKKSRDQGKQGSPPSLFQDYQIG